METETIPLMRVYKRNGKINADFSEECLDFEMYGFLKMLIKNMENKLELNDNGSERY